MIIYLCVNVEIAEEWQTLITGAVLPLLSPPEGRPRVSSEKESRTIQTKYNVNKTGIKIVHAFGSVRFGSVSMSLPPITTALMYVNAKSIFRTTEKKKEMRVHYTAS